MPGRTEPGKNLYFRCSDAQTLCKAFHYPEPHSPLRRADPAQGRRPAQERLSAILCAPQGGWFELVLACTDF